MWFRPVRNAAQRWAALVAVLVSTACFADLPSRPKSLDALGVRVGAEWLRGAPLYEDAHVGSITQIVKRAGTGETAIVGTDGAALYPAKGGAPRVVRFAESAGHPELIEWAGGAPRYVDRGGGGWQTGALLGPDGARLWQPDAGDGMDDLSGGDVDGDGVPEFVVGYNGGGGVRLLDATGKERWREADSNVWHVEILDTDGDGKPEIVHSNAAGKLTIRDAGGKLVARREIETYFSQFAPVTWPPGRSGVLHAADDATDVLGFDGKVVAHFETPGTTSLTEARASVAQFDGKAHLVIVTSQSRWDRTQVFVFDPAGVLRYREILAGDCHALSATEPDSFLFGCGRRVLRYTKAR